MLLNIFQDEDNDNDDRLPGGSGGNISGSTSPELDEPMENLAEAQLDEPIEDPPESPPDEPMDALPEQQLDEQVEDNSGPPLPQRCASYTCRKTAYSSG